MIRWICSGCIRVLKCEAMITSFSNMSARARKSSRWVWPYAALASGAWQLRGSLTLYDAAYVRLAAQLGVPLVTIDQRLARTASSSCQVVVPCVD